MNENLEEINRMEKIKAMILRKILSKEAIERLGRIKLVKPELAAELELYIIQLYQAGKMKGEITDEQLRSILDMLTSKKRFNILK